MEGRRGNTWRHCGHSSDHSWWTREGYYGNGIKIQVKGYHFNGVVVPGDEASEVPAPSHAAHTPTHRHNRVSSEVEPPQVVSDFNVPVLTGDYAPCHSDTREGSVSDFKIFWWRGGGYRIQMIYGPLNMDGVP